MMKLNKRMIATIPYTDVNFRWIMDHYDHHLRGTCYYKDKLSYFETIRNKKGLFKDKDKFFCKIYSLNILQKISVLILQKKFEWSVGYEWTYLYRGQRL